MSRGGRGGGRGGGRRNGPDMSWHDEDPNEIVLPLKRVPGPAFPERYIPVPKPLTAVEKAEVALLLQTRDRIRKGPLYAVLEPSSLLDEKGKINPRAAYDPFNDQDRYTKRYHRKKRTVPDLSERGGYTLRLFPVELWPVLDPKRRQREYWDTLDKDVAAKLAGSKGVKRKRKELQFNDADAADGPGDIDNKSASGSDDDDDVIDGGRRKKGAKTRQNDSTRSKGREKKGLDAEDDYPEVEQQDDDGDGPGGAGAEDEPQDSEFGSDDDDDEYDDYNAENYFDDGADDDMADMDDDGGGGGGGGDYY